MQLVGNGCLWPMTGIDYRVGGYCFSYLRQTLLHLLPRAFRKIGTADAHAEQGVATEEHLLVFKKEEARTVTVAGGMYHPQRMVTEANEVAITKQPAYWRLIVANLHAEEGGSLLGQTLYQGLVCRTYLYLQMVLLKEMGIAEVMVQMAVSCQQMDGFQLVFTKILVDSITLLVIIGTTVNDDTLATVVTHHIAVLLQWIHRKTINLNHKQ